MIWGSRKSDDDNRVEHNTRDEPPPDFSKQPLPREKLPRKLQRLVDREDDYFDELYSPYSVDSTDTSYRYAGYANRIRTLLLSAHRHVAYTSDIGESFRPVAHPWLIRSAYAVSWTYILGDVGHEGYKAYLRNRRILAPPCEAYKDATDLKAEQVARGMVTGNVAGPLSSKPSNKSGSPSLHDGNRQGDVLVPWPTARIPLIEDYRVVMAKRAVFQSIASMALPALTIHSVVRYSGKALKGAKTTLVRTWVPIGLGLAVVPFLPYIFDEPIEEAIEWSFRSVLRTFAGEDAVKPSLPLSHSASDHAAPLSSLLKLQDQKEHLDKSHKERQLGEGADISWQEYKGEKLRAREQRKKERKGREEEVDSEGKGGWLTGWGFNRKTEKEPKEKGE